MKLIIEIILFPINIVVDLFKLIFEPSGGSLVKYKDPL